MGRSGRQGSKCLGTGPRRSPDRRVRAHHADGDAGSASRATSQVVLAGTEFEDRLDRGATAGDRVRARQARGLGNTRRPDASPQRLLIPGDRRRQRARADSIDEGGGLVAAPWERRRTRREPGVANGRVEHPTRAAPAGGRERAADAISTTGPTRRARHLVSRHGARRSNGLRRPSSSSEPKGTREAARALRPPRWFTYESSFAGLSFSAPRRAPRLRGCTARRVVTPHGATRAGRVVPPSTRCPWSRPKTDRPKAVSVRSLPAGELFP